MTLQNHHLYVDRANGLVERLLTPIDKSKESSHELVESGFLLLGTFCSYYVRQDQFIKLVDFPCRASNALIKFRGRKISSRYFGL